MNPSQQPAKSAKGPRERDYLRRGILQLSIMLSLAAGIVGNSYIYNAVKQSAHDDQHKKLNVAKKKLSDAKFAQSIIEDYLQKFNDYRRAGIIGEENRMSWIQVAVDSAKERNLAAMHYNIEAREAFRPDYLFQEGNYQLRVSNMNLNWVLLHENDFVSVLQRLSDKGLGVYHVRECELRRVKEEITLDPQAANITSDCKLQWFSVDISQALLESS